MFIKENGMEIFFLIKYGYRPNSVSKTAGGGGEGFEVAELDKPWAYYKISIKHRRPVAGGHRYGPGEIFRRTGEREREKKIN